MIKYIKKAARALGIKVIYKHSRDMVLKYRGFNLLSLTQTTAFMAQYEVKAIVGEKILLPQIINCANYERVVFEKKESITDQVYVWDYQLSGKNATLSKYGSVIINRNVLCADWNHNSFYKDIWKKDGRPIKTIPKAVALFSQLQDGIFYGGYYDFVFLVATKLCRIMDACPNESFSDITISYPLFNAVYEKEYLQLLGFNIDNLIDSRIYKVVSPQLITGNSAHWYPNLTDVLALKRHIEMKVKPVKTASNRIYISRKGRRHIKNEDELIAMLKKFDFMIIADIERSVSEQIDIYLNASFIIGPHGASFSNIIWCEPGTHLMELFSCNYVPDFFLYLAVMMKMEYSAYYEGAADGTVDYLDGLVEDIDISVSGLSRYLANIFDQAKL